ncbi:MAG: aldo/keto reductase [Actinomycetota bacterium]|nr:aldo/keto reductase [Actinomycetota bacterium]
MATHLSEHPIASAGTFRFGELNVHRLGYGAMQLTGEGVWGPPDDPDGCVRVLRRAVELGVDFIDTADSYGPYISEDLIRQALHPYADDLVIATKAGLTRTGPGVWPPVGRPEYLRQECEMSLRRLGLERIDLFQLHRIDPKVPADEQFGLLAELIDEGKVRHVGLSEVSVSDIEAAREIVPVVTVQNLYNLAERKSEDVLDYCEAQNIGFIPWFPIASGELAKPGGPVDDVVKTTGAKPSQIALAWLLRRSPVMLPIPGTKTVEHLEENCAAATVELSDEQVSTLTAAG